MHFLAETVERKCPDLLRLKRELTAVLEAARLDRAQLEAELAQLGTAIRELARELAVQEEALAAKGGQFHDPIINVIDSVKWIINF